MKRRRQFVNLAADVVKQARSVLSLLAKRGFGLVAFSLVLTLRGGAQTGLQVNFGVNGLERMSYNGTLLENVKAVPADAFHIWHMRCTDLQGKPRTEGPYSWGEAATARHWDPATRAWTYTFPWGSLRATYVQHGDALDIVVDATNAAKSGVIFDGASLYPLALHFPTLPAGFGNTTFPQLAYNTTGPSVTVADYGKGEVVAVSPAAERPLYTGFFPADNGTAYTALISGTVPDGLATFQPHNQRPLRPGQSDRYTLSLRFAASGTPAYTLAADSYSNWIKVYPSTLYWTDRRAIGTVFLASSAQGDLHHAAGFSNNPRRYFTDGNAEDFNVNTPEGLAKFQHRMLAQARRNVEDLKVLGAQGAITWDIEGEQFPQDTSYVCAPDLIAQVAPEMETLISDAASPYAGMRLDDAYFKIMRSAGFRVGVCIRPQHFSLRPDGTAEQSFLPDSAVAAELTRKIRFAHDRWGATLFYIDSTVDSNRGVLPAAIFKQVALAFPDSLLIPEESTPLFYAYTAPFKSFIYHGDLGTDADVAHLYPEGFSAVLINNVAPGKLAAAEPGLLQQINRGDVLMGQVDYGEPNNATIASIYQRSLRTASTNHKDHR